MNLLEEIQNAPVEWKELGEVFNLKNGYTPSKKNKEYWIDGTIPWFRLEDIRTNGRFLNKAIQTISETAVKGNIFPANSLIVSTTATIGEVALISVPFLCNQQITALYKKEEFEEKIDIKFAFYYLQLLSNEMKKGISIGSFPIVSVSKLKKYKIPIPPLSIQEKIVQTLDKFTDYVTELTSELTSELTLRQKQYSYFRDYLLNFEDNSYKVEWKSLGELFEFKNGLNKSKEFFGSGTPIVNYTDVYKNIKLHSDNLNGRVIVTDKEIERYSVRRGDVFFTRTSETKEEIGLSAVLLEDIPQGVFSGFVLRARPKTNLLLPEYCSYCFSSSEFRKDVIRYSTYTTRALTNGGTLSKLKIPIPPLSIQEKIVHVLDNFDTVCNDLNIGLPKEIELRQKQYEYFRDQLLTYTAEGVYTDSTVQYRQDLIRLLWYVFGPIKVTFGAISDLSRGKRVVKSQLSENKGYPVYQNSLRPLGFYSESNRQAKQSIIICAGAAGDIAFIDVDFWAADDAYTLTTEVEISDKFLYYVLLSKQSIIKSKVRKASIPRLSKTHLERIEFYLPPLEEQERIVSILDKFDTLTSDLSQGLPKEIALRQKQYEYFRDCLLTFN